MAQNLRVFVVTRQIGCARAFEDGNGFVDVADPALARIADLSIVQNPVRAHVARGCAVSKAARPQRAVTAEIFVGAHSSLQTGAADSDAIKEFTGGVRRFFPFEVGKQLFVIAQLSNPRHDLQNSGVE